MDFSVLLSDLRDVAEKYKGKTTEPQVSTLAYVDMFTKILKRAQKVTDDYGDQIQVLWVALNQLAAIYKDLSQCQARDNLCRFIFGMCARTVLNIQWSQLDDDSKSKKNLCSAVNNVHKILSDIGFRRFQLILDLMESHWTHPVLSQIMSSDEDDIEGGLEYIQQEDPDILKLRIEIMMKENCEEFALNLCHWSLRHPSLKNDLKIKEQQIYMLYKQSEYGKMQEVCESIVCHDGIKVMSHLAKVPTNQSLCIRLAQVFLVHDWVKSDRNCCTQELLKLWIHHQYLADKDEERFLDSIWTVAKVSRDTKQIGVLIEGVRKECGDMFIQLYTELCKYALNIDKGNLEIEEKQGNEEEVTMRKHRISKTCVRMAFMLKEYDFRMSRISGLTAFALDPTSDNLNLVNKLYWTIKNTSATAANSKVNPATLYEVERLLGLMRPELLNPDHSWKQLIPICKKYKMDCNGEDPESTDLQDLNQPNSVTAGPSSSQTAQSMFSASDLFKRQQAVQSEPQKPATQQPIKIKTEPDIEKSHVERMLQNRNLSKEQIEKILSERFPRNALKGLSEGPPLSMKQLDKTIDDLKKSIYRETQYREALEKKFSTFSQAKRTAELKTKEHEHTSRQDQYQTQKSAPYGRQHSVPSCSTASQLLQRQLSQGSAGPPRAHSQQGHLSSSMGTMGGSPPPAHYAGGRISSPVFYQPQSQSSSRTQSASPASGSRVGVAQQPSTHTVHHGQGSTLSKSPHIPGISPSQVKGHYGSPTGSQPGSAHMQGGQKLHTISHPNVLRPADSSQQECAKIAQHIAEMHERQRADKERLERIRLQGRIDGAKIALNSRNVPNSNQISELLSMTIKDGKSVSLQQFQKELSGSNIQSLNTNDPMKNYEGKCTQQQQGVIQQAKVPNTQTPISSTNCSSEQAQDKKKNMKTHKYYLTTEKAMNQLKRDHTGNINLGSSKVSIKPMFSMVVPKSMTRPEKQDQLVKTVTNMVKEASHKPVTIQPKTFTQMQKPQAVHQVTLANTSTSVVTSTATMQSNSFGTVTAMRDQTNAQYVGLLPLNTNITQPAQVDSLNITPVSFLQPMLQNVSQSQLMPADSVVSSVNLAPTPAALPVNQPTVNQTMDFSQTDLQNLNTLANASLSILGQANNQSISGIQNVHQEQLPSVQQYFGSGVVESQQMNIGEPQVMQPETIVATPLYTCSATGYTQQPFATAQQPFLNTGQVLNNPQQGQILNNQQQQMLIAPQSNIAIQQPEIQQMVTIQNLPVSSFPQSQPTIQSSMTVHQTQMGTIPSHIGSSLPSVNQIMNTYQAANQEQQFQQGSRGVETGMSGAESVETHTRAPSQFLAAPELSPAVVQQILSSLKRSNAQSKTSPQSDTTSASCNADMANSIPTVVQNDSKLKESEASMTDNLKQFLMKKDDPNVRQSILEATQKILQLRKQYKQYTSLEKSNQEFSASSKGGILKQMMESEDDLRTVMQQRSHTTVPQKSANVMKPGTFENQNVPDLPDLRASDIDSVLGNVFDIEPATMQEGIKRKTEIVRQTAENLVLKSESVMPSQMQSGVDIKTEKGSFISEKQMFDGPSNVGGNASERIVQSTYMNANRIAKEREGKTQHSSLSANSSFQRTDAKGVISPSQNCSCMLYKEHLNTPVDKRLCNCRDTKILPQQIPSDQVLRTNETVACGICFKKFNSLSAIKDHVKKACTSPSSIAAKPVQLKDFEYSVIYKCTNCNFMNGNEKISTKHVESCSSNVTSSPVKAQLITLYKCCMCSDMFSDKQSTYRHVSKLCPKLKVVSTQRDIQDNYQKLKSANKLQRPVSGERKGGLLNAEHKQLNSTCKRQVSEETLSTKLAKHISSTGATSGENVCVSKTFEDGLNKGTLRMSQSGEKWSMKEDILQQRIGHEGKQNMPISKHIRKNEDAAKFGCKGDASSNQQSFTNFAAGAKDLSHKDFRGYENQNFEDKGMAELNSEVQPPFGSNDELSDLDACQRAKRDKRLSEKYYLELFSLMEERKQKQRNMSVKDTDVKDSREHDRWPTLKSNDHDLKAEPKKEKGEKMTTESKIILNKNLEELKGKSEKTVKSVNNKQQKHVFKSSEDLVSRNFRTRSVQKASKKCYTSNRLREKRFIKRQKFLIDEMGQQSADDISKTVDIKSDKKKIKKIRSNEPKGPAEVKIKAPPQTNTCILCDYSNKAVYINDYIKHFVQRHNVGYVYTKKGYYCRYCKFHLSDHHKKPMTSHLLLKHKKHILQLIKGRELHDETLAFVSKTTEFKNSSPNQDSSPKQTKTGNQRTGESTEKISKHLKAVAQRKRCAENLKKIAKQRASVERETSESELDNIEITEDSGSDISSLRRGRQRKCDQRTIQEGNEENSNSGRSTMSYGDVKNDSRSRSSSFSSKSSRSGISSVVKSLRNRRKQSDQDLKSVEVEGSKLMLTRSGRAIKRPDSDSSNDSDASDENEPYEGEEDTDDNEHANIERRRSLRSKRFPEKVMARQRQMIESSNDSSVEEVTSRITRLASSKQEESKTDSHLTVDKDKKHVENQTGNILDDTKINKKDDRPQKNRTEERANVNPFLSKTYGLRGQGKTSEMEEVAKQLDMMVNSIAETEEKKEHPDEEGRRSDENSDSQLQKVYILRRRSAKSDDKDVDQSSEDILNQDKSKSDKTADSKATCDTDKHKQSNMSVLIGPDEECSGLNTLPLFTIGTTSNNEKPQVNTTVHTTTGNSPEKKDIHSVIKAQTPVESDDEFACLRTVQSSVHLHASSAEEVSVPMKGKAEKENSFGTEFLKFTQNRTTENPVVNSENNSSNEYAETKQIISSSSSVQLEAPKQSFDSAFKKFAEVLCGPVQNEHRQSVGVEGSSKTPPQSKDFSSAFEDFAKKSDSEKMKNEYVRDPKTVLETSSEDTSDYDAFEVLGSGINYKQYKEMYSLRDCSVRIKRLNLKHVQQNLSPETVKPVKNKKIVINDDGQVAVVIVEDKDRKSVPPSIIEQHTSEIRTEFNEGSSGTETDDFNGVQNNEERGMLNISDNEKIAMSMATDCGDNILPLVLVTPLEKEFCVVECTGDSVEDEQDISKEDRITQIELSPCKSAKPVVYSSSDSFSEVEKSPEIDRNGLLQESMNTLEIEVELDQQDEEDTESTTTKDSKETLALYNMESKTKDCSMEISSHEWNNTTETKEGKDVHMTEPGLKPVTRSCEDKRVSDHVLDQFCETEKSLIKIDSDDNVTKQEGTVLLSEDFPEELSMNALPKGDKSEKNEASLYQTEGHNSSRLNTEKAHNGEKGLDRTCSILKGNKGEIRSVIKDTITNAAVEQKKLTENEMGIDAIANTAVEQEKLTETEIVIKTETFISKDLNAKEILVTETNEEPAKEKQESETAEEPDKSVDETGLNKSAISLVENIEGYSQMRHTPESEKETFVSFEEISEEKDISILNSEICSEKADNSSQETKYDSFFSKDESSIQSNESTMESDVNRSKQSEGEAVTVTVIPSNVGILTYCNDDISDSDIEPIEIGGMSQQYLDADDECESTCEKSIWKSETLETKQINELSNTITVCELSDSIHSNEQSELNRISIHHSETTLSMEQPKTCNIEQSQTSEINKLSEVTGFSDSSEAREVELSTTTQISEQSETAHIRNKSETTLIKEQTENAKIIEQSRLTVDCEQLEITEELDQFNVAQASEPIDSVHTTDQSEIKKVVAEITQTIEQSETRLIYDRSITEQTSDQPETTQITEQSETKQASDQAKSSKMDSEQFNNAQASEQIDSVHTTDQSEIKKVVAEITQTIEQSETRLIYDRSITEQTSDQPETTQITEQSETKQASDQAKSSKIDSKEQSEIMQIGEHSGTAISEHFQTAQITDQFENEQSDNTKITEHSESTLEYERLKAKQYLELSDRDHASEQIETTQISEQSKLKLGNKQPESMQITEPLESSNVVKEASAFENNECSKTAMHTDKLSETMQVVDQSETSADEHIDTLQLDEQLQAQTIEHSETTENVQIGPQTEPLDVTDQSVAIKTNKEKEILQINNKSDTVEIRRQPDGTQSRHSGTDPVNEQEEISQVIEQQETTQTHNELGTTQSNEESETMQVSEKLEIKPRKDQSETAEISGQSGTKIAQVNEHTEISKQPESDKANSWTETKELSDTKEISEPLEKTHVNRQMETAQIEEEICEPDLRNEIDANSEIKGFDQNPGAKYMDYTDSSRNELAEIRKELVETKTCKSACKAEDQSFETVSAKHLKKFKLCENLPNSNKSKDAEIKSDNQLPFENSKTILGYHSVDPTVLSSETNVEFKADDKYLERSPILEQDIIHEQLNERETVAKENDLADTQFMVCEVNAISDIDEEKPPKSFAKESIMKRTVASIIPEDNGISLPVMESMKNTMDSELKPKERENNYETKNVLVSHFTERRSSSEKTADTCHYPTSLKEEDGSHEVYTHGISSELPIMTEENIPTDEAPDHVTKDDAISNSDGNTNVAKHLCVTTVDSQIFSQENMKVCEEAVKESRTESLQTQKSSELQSQSCTGNNDVQQNYTAHSDLHCESQVGNMECENEITNHVSTGIEMDEPERVQACDTEVIGNVSKTKESEQSLSLAQHKSTGYTTSAKMPSVSACSEDSMEEPVLGDVKRSSDREREYESCVKVDKQEKETGVLGEDSEQSVTVKLPPSTEEECIAQNDSKRVTEERNNQTSGHAVSSLEHTLKKDFASVSYTVEKLKTIAKRMLDHAKLEKVVDGIKEENTCEDIPESPHMECADLTEVVQTSLQVSPSVHMNKYDRVSIKEEDITQTDGSERTDGNISKTALLQEMTFTGREHSKNTTLTREPLDIRDESSKDIVEKTVDETLNEEINGLIDDGLYQVLEEVLQNEGVNEAVNSAMKSILKEVCIINQKVTPKETVKADLRQQTQPQCHSVLESAGISGKTEIKNGGRTEDKSTETEDTSECGSQDQKIDGIGYRSANIEDTSICRLQNKNCSLESVEIVNSLQDVIEKVEELVSKTIYEVDTKKSALPDVNSAPDTIVADSNKKKRKAAADGLEKAKSLKKIRLSSSPSKSAGKIKKSFESLEGHLGNSRKQIGNKGFQKARSFSLREKPKKDYKELLAGKDTIMKKNIETRKHERRKSSIMLSKTHDEVIKDEKGSIKNTQNDGIKHDQNDSKLKFICVEKNTYLGNRMITRRHSDISIVNRAEESLDESLQGVSESLEEFQRRTESVKLAHKKFSCKPYECDFNFDEVNDSANNTGIHKHNIHASKVTKTEEVNALDRKKLHKTETNAARSDNTGKKRHELRPGKDSASPGKTLSSMTVKLVAAHGSNESEATNRVFSRHIFPCDKVKKYTRRHSATAETLPKLESAASDKNKSISSNKADKVQVNKIKDVNNEDNSSNKKTTVSKVRALRELHKADKPFVWESGSPIRETRSSIKKEQIEVEAPVAQTGDKARKLEVSPVRDTRSRSRNPSTQSANEEHTLQKTKEVMEMKHKSGQRNDQSFDLESVDERSAELKFSTKKENIAQNRSLSKDSPRSLHSSKDTAKPGSKDATKFTLKDTTKPISKDAAGSNSNTAKAGLKATTKPGSKDTAEMISKDTAKSDSKAEGKTCLKDSVKASLKDTGKTSSKESGKTSSKESGKTSLKETGKSVLKYANKPGSKGADKPVLKDTAKASLKNMAKSGPKDAAKIVSKDAAKTGSKIVSKPCLKDMSRKISNNAIKSSNEEDKNKTQAAEESEHQGCDLIIDKRSCTPKQSRNRSKSLDKQKSPKAKLKQHSPKANLSQNELLRGNDTKPKRKATSQLREENQSKRARSLKSTRSRSRSTSQDKTIRNKFMSKKHMKDKLELNSEKRKNSGSPKVKNVSEKQNLSVVREDRKIAPKSKVTNLSGTKVNKSTRKRSQSPGKAKKDSDECQKCKLDGTSNSPTNSPIKGGVVVRCAVCESSESQDVCSECSGLAEPLKGQKYVYDCKRAPVRQIIHKGKVFEIQKGSVTETDIQSSNLSEKSESREMSPVLSPTSPTSKPQISNIGHRTRSAASVEASVLPTGSHKRDHSPDHDYMNEKSMISTRKINNYISETLKKIRIERKNLSSSSKWRVEKKTCLKGPKFPYSFKKSKKN